MNKRAYIRWWGRLDGQKRHATLRIGPKGHGYLVAETWVYPDDSADVERAERLFQAAAKREGIDIIGSDWHDRPATRRSAQSEQARTGKGH